MTRQIPGRAKRRSAPLLLLICLLVAACSGRAVGQVPDSLNTAEFAALSTSLSEPQGFFDTDNLISNEDAYLHPIGTLRRLGISGGVYLGVGPGQNFSYISAVRPRMVFIVDIRRDNLLQHLLYKSIFSLSRNRLEYLSLLFGRAAPADTASWGARDINSLLAYIDSSRSDTAVTAAIQRRVLQKVQTFGMSLTAADLATLSRFHRTFIEQGPSLRFNSFGRAPQPYYPDLRRLMTERDRSGQQAGYLAREEDFQFLRQLQLHNLVVPVVGDFAGNKALVAVGNWVRQRGEHVSVFYTSNVEQYLMGGGTFARFAANVASLPRTQSSLFIRSYFQGGHPQAVAGYHVTQLMQYMDPFLALQRAGRIQRYSDLVTLDQIPPS